MVKLICYNSLEIMVFLNEFLTRNLELREAQAAKWLPTDRTLVDKIKKNL